MELPSICSAFDNPDLQARLDSLSALSFQIIPEDYIEEEIVPRLMKYLDDCEEVLLLLISQVLLISKSLKAKSTVLELIRPLEILTNIIDENVRKASIKAIIEILKSFSLTKEYGIKIFKNLIKRDESGKLSALEFVLAVFPYLSKKGKGKLLDKTLILYKEGNHVIRNSVSDVLVSIKHEAEHNPIFQSFFELFIKDPEDRIRILGLNIGLSLKENLDLPSSIIHDSSWKVRYYLSQNLSELIQVLDQGVVCEVVKEYLNDPEAEVRNVTFSSLAEIFKISLDETNVSEILTLIQDMSSSLPYKPKEVILAILRICPILGSRHTAVYLMSSLEALFTCTNPNIELLLMQEIVNFHQVLSEDFIKTLAFPVFFRLLDSRSWKTRSDALRFISNIAKIVKETDFNEFFRKILIGSLNDLIHAVRMSAIKSISEIIKVYGEGWFKDNVSGEILEKSNSDCYMNRVTAVNLMVEIVDFVDFGKFGGFFFEIFNRLCEDKVVNVRVVVGRLGRKICNSRVLENCSEGFLGKIERMKEDNDEDVRRSVCDEYYII